MGERRGTKALEIWCRRVTEGYPGVSVDNMTTSWRDGLAFCALIHRFRPDLIEFDRLTSKDARYNNDLAFTTAERHLGIPALLDAEDMVECQIPDRLSVLTYVAQYYRAFGEASFAMGLISPGRGSPLRRENSASNPSTPVTTPESEQPPKKSGLVLGRRELCEGCGEAVFLAERLRIGGRTFHRRCLRCARCGAQLSLANCYETESHVYCCEVCPDEERAPRESSEQTDSDNEEVATPAPDQDDEWSASCESALEAHHPPPSPPSAPNNHNVTSSALDLNVISQEEVSAEQNQEEEEKPQEQEAEVLPELPTSAPPSVVSKWLLEDKEEEKADDKPMQIMTNNSSITSVHSSSDLETTGTKQDEIQQAQKEEMPTIVVEEEKVYPDDLNPFGDEEEEVEEKKESPKKVISLNPFGSDSDEEEVKEEVKPSPRRLIPVEPSLNPFWEDGDEEEEEKPVPRPRSFQKDFPSTPNPMPRTSLPASSPLGSLKKKKKPPPPPPPTASNNTTPTPSPSSTLSKARKNRRAPLPPGSSPPKETKDELNRRQQVAPEKSHQGEWKRKKRPAPGLPIPPRRQVIAIPIEEARRELEMIEVQQRGLEKQGVRLEEEIRTRLEKSVSAEDEHSLPVDVEEMVMQLMDLVMEKNELFRRQAELMYLKRQHRLEEQQAELEWRIRCLLQKQDKVEADVALEEELINRLVEVVEQRNEIVDCLEMDRKREADEDKSVREHRQMISDRHLQPEEEKEVMKAKGKKLKIKLLQKGKKDKKKNKEAKELKDAENSPNKSSQKSPKKKWF
ncbi:MICAL-like protein 1 [Neocloeon triangulifer]|uniref:MICAL-like protein 1 n=1 Tax=Neocloeon triangulifer TaxID=2078957 RepID=UPI00286ECCFC|nr:MICAL-like protein 1 [Neocloeon triangulifer]XP_059483052.1 MICAL-like protein 1 [Neocloeon triangulifer]